MNVVEWCAKIFGSPDLKDKLLSVDLITDFSFIEIKDFDFSFPNRSNDIKFSSKKIKFPKIDGFKDPRVRAKALAFFANHELEAIEMMCAAIIKFGSMVSAIEFSKISRGIVSSIKDEQKHLSLYIGRIEELNSSISEYSLNDFFWKQFHKLDSFDAFFSLMSLTLEAANLDFCLFYEKVFQSIGDYKTSGIMRQVYEDEISHVKLGVFWLNKWRQDKSLWEYYLSHLPDKISPERSKGIEFSIDSRKIVGLDSNYLTSLLNFSDTFLIPKRKTNNGIL